MTEIIVRRRRLHAGQQRLKSSPARFRVAMFGRRWGKNVLGIDEAMTVALEGRRVGWFEPTYKYLLEAWRELSHRLRPVAKSISDQEKRIELITGGLIEAWTCDTPDPARSRAYHLAIINEAGLIRSLKAIWEESIRPALTDYAGRVLFLGTPKGASHDFSMIHAKADGLPDWAAFRGPTSENPHIDPAEIEAARRDMPPDAFAQEYEGIPAPDGGNPFGLDAIRASVMTPQEWEQAQAHGERIAFGLDFGRAQDFNVALALGRQWETTALDRWHRIPWEESYKRFAQVIGPTFTVGDATGVGDPIVETLQRQYGIHLDPFVFTPKSKQELMERLASQIQQRKLRIPPGVVVSELETFTYEHTAHGVRYTAPEGMHDDCVVALALAVKGRAAFGELPLPAKVWHPDDDSHPGMDVVASKRRFPRKGMAGQEMPSRPSFIPRGPLVPV